jgi:hypothetical protein
LFVPTIEKGRHWHDTQAIIQRLVQVNRQRGELNFVLGMPAAHPRRSAVAREFPDIQVLGMDQTLVRGNELLNLARRTPGAGKPSGKIVYQHFREHAGRALECGVWLALSDEVDQPFAPVRPFGVLTSQLHSLRMVVQTPRQQHSLDSHLPSASIKDHAQFALPRIAVLRSEAFTEQLYDRLTKLASVGTVETTESGDVDGAMRAA